jgi:hypothetical protein
MHFLFGSGYAGLGFGPSPLLPNWFGAWRSEERERAFVRFEAGPAEQAQTD